MLKEVFTTLITNIFRNFAYCIEYMEKDMSGLCKGDKR